LSNNIIVKCPSSQNTWSANSTDKYVALLECFCCLFYCCLLILCCTIFVFHSAPQTKRATPTCQTTIRLGNQATIQSPNYPSYYEDDLDCLWYIEAPLGSMIKLEFLDFDLEADSSCSYDYVAVHDGETEFAGRLGAKTCGTSSVFIGSGPHVSTSNTMTVKFHTDGSNTRPGFQARITKV